MLTSCFLRVYVSLLLFYKDSGRGTFPCGFCCKIEVIFGDAIICDSHKGDFASSFNVNFFNVFVGLSKKPVLRFRVITHIVFIVDEIRIAEGKIRLAFFNRVNHYVIAIRNNIVFKNELRDSTVKPVPDCGIVSAVNYGVG